MEEKNLSLEEVKKVISEKGVELSEKDLKDVAGGKAIIIHHALCPKCKCHEAVRVRSFDGEVIAIVCPQCGTV